MVKPLKSPLQCSPFTVAAAPLVHNGVIVAGKPFQRISPCKAIVFLFEAYTLHSVTEKSTQYFVDFPLHHVEGKGKANK